MYVQDSEQLCKISVQCVTTIFEWTAEVVREPPFQMNTMNVMSPFSFKNWLEKQRPTLTSGGPIDMFGAQFETEVMGTNYFFLYKIKILLNHFNNW